MGKSSGELVQQRASGQVHWDGIEWVGGWPQHVQDVFSEHRGLQHLQRLEGCCCHSARIELLCCLEGFG